MKKNYIVLASLISCIILYFTEQVLETTYIIKTAIKIILFLGIPLYYIKNIENKTIKEALKFDKLDKKQFKMGIFFGAGSFLIVLIAYFVLRGFIDLDSIAAELQNKSKITPSNFWIIGLYITIGNSFLEEFFFRGFIFLNLYNRNYKKLAYVFSSALFGLYHIAIFQTWFNIGLVILALVGLIGIGLVFNWLDTKSDNFINSWIVHILADSAIIIIGLKMFGMI
ncbi:CPBP family intramembrane glutamic endopeptidase [Sporosalibacterium faouarense]|uniref:CPBP family intramembrane glutamic endopeptidase n=1 Tax=Sporosalibacterium faouarense TaxID=516123 RepID=UPI00192B3C21|nr:CPBP family intramembrane glutamic endopeptidase [Sporosalibacterium faouarense]